MCADAAQTWSCSLHRVVKHCKGSAFLLASVKSDPLDAWGEQSELEIEVGGWLTPSSPRPTETKVAMQRKGGDRKKIFEKLPRVPCHTASCADWAVLFVGHKHEYWVDVKRKRPRREEKEKHRAMRIEEPKTKIHWPTKCVYWLKGLFEYCFVVLYVLLSHNSSGYTMIYMTYVVYISMGKYTNC